MISFPLRLRGPVRGGASSPAGPDGALLTKVSGRNPHPETPRFPGLRLGSMVIVPGGGSVRQWLLSGGGVVLDPPTNVSADRIKAAFYYSSQLQTWSQAGRKHVESQLRTCLKLVFSTFHLSNTRMNQRTCCGSQPVFRENKVKSWSKACRKPARTCRKPGCKPGRLENQVCSWLE